MHQIHFLLGIRTRPRWGSLQCPRPLPPFKGPTSKGMEGNGRGEEKVKRKEGERWREGFGPPKNFGVAPPMQRRPITQSNVPQHHNGLSTFKASSTLATIVAVFTTISANSTTSICCGFVFVVPTSVWPRLLYWSQVRRRCVLCQWPVIIICLCYNMADFMDKFAEFGRNLRLAVDEALTQRIAPFRSATDQERSLYSPKGHYS